MMPNLKNVMEYYETFNGRLKSEIKELELENERLKKIIAKELSENDELGSEFVLVNILKKQNAKYKDALSNIGAYFDCLNCEGLMSSELVCDDHLFDRMRMAREALKDE